MFEFLFYELSRFFTWLASQFNVNALIAGVLGSVTPFIILMIFGERILGPDGGAVVILMVIICLPVVLIGAIGGGLIVWIIEQARVSGETKWAFLIGYLGGFIPWIFLAIYVLIS